MGWFILSPAGEWPPYWPGLGQFLGALAAIGMLGVSARRIRWQPGASALRRRWPLFLAGLGWGVWQLGAWAIADVTRSAWLLLAWLGVVGTVLLVFAYRRLWPLDRPALLGAGTLATGTWLFWSLLAFVQEVDDANRPDDTSGMALVGLVALLLVGDLCRLPAPILARAQEGVNRPVSQAHSRCCQVGGMSS